ncbi:MAG: glycerophosphodiester phosphodiesterase, partial [Deltaproteobacteria bacterium]|nr:glycerophosphodiester phosphodiesterase [Deltaproteobacteria bacterium]
RSLHHRAPDLPISPLVSEDLPDLVELARDLGAGTVSPHQDWITSRDVAALHAAGVRVVVWTANTPEEWARLVDMGVDGIITDNPAGLLAWMGRQRAVPSR